MSTASSVPIWVMAVKAAPGSAAPGKNSPTMRRCAEEEIGRNSVRPWTRPRIIASIQFTWSTLRHSGIYFLKLRRLGAFSRSPLHLLRLLRSRRSHLRHRQNLRSRRCHRRLRLRKCRAGSLLKWHHKGHLHSPQMHRLGHNMRVLARGHHHRVYWSRRRDVLGMLRSVPLAKRVDRCSWTLGYLGLSWVTTLFAFMCLACCETVEMTHSAF